MDVSMELALQKVVQDSMESEDLFDDDIDTIDDEIEAMSFETDRRGNYVRLGSHLVQQVQPGVSKPNVHQRTELFHESVIQTLADSWSRCKQLCARLLTGYPFVGIWMDVNTEEVGGFSMKSKRDEQKGMIIECINSGRIATLVTPALQKLGYFVFCPNAATLGAMQDFPILTSTIYKICFMSPNGAVWLTDIEVSYHAIANMIIRNFYMQDMIVSTLEGYVPGETEVDAFESKPNDVYETREEQHRLDSTDDGDDSSDTSGDSNGSSGGQERNVFEDVDAEYDDGYDEEPDIGPEDDPRAAMWDKNEIPDDVPDSIPIDMVGDIPDDFI